MKNPSKVRYFLNSLDKYAEKVLEWLFNFVSWFLADVAYTLLPIAIIAIIKSITYNNGDYLYLSPEWSFATIVSIGTAITSLIKLKTEIQYDFSHRLYSGTRLFIFLLIAAVIVLSLVVMRDDGLNINSAYLWTAQISLLLLSITSLYIAHYAEEKQLKYESSFPHDMGRGRYYKILNRKLSRLEDQIIQMRFALDKHSEIEFSQEIPINEIRFWESNRRDTFIQRFSHVKKIFIDIDPLVLDLINSPMPNDSEVDNQINETTTKSEGQNT
jgi:hypothetical protein